MYLELDDASRDEPHKPRELLLLLGGPGHTGRVKRQRHQGISLHMESRGEAPKGSAAERFRVSPPMMLKLWTLGFTVPCLP